MKKIIIVVLSVIMLYASFVLGQVFTLKSQQLGYNGNDGHFESTVNVGGAYHRMVYYDNCTNWGY